LNTGANPMGTLFAASNGKLYGLASNGGISNKGTFFEYDIASNILTKIVDFDGPVNGSNPYSHTMMEGSNGKLYGTTPLGGLNNKGILFEYELISATFTKKLDFAATTFATPAGRLTEVAPGILYGTANQGGAGDGVIFEYNFNTNTLTNKIDLEFAVTGRNIYDGLMLATNGKLYGLAHSGGPGYGGTLIEFDIASSLITKVVDFVTLDTGLITTFEPYGGPMQASNGKIYGTSAYGSDGGDFFEYDYVTDTYIPLFDFWDIGSVAPYHLRLIEVITPPTDVWPGDCNYDLAVDNTDFLQLGLAWNESGPVRPGASLNWVAQPAPDWPGAFPSSLNHKHADTNGDGTVNSSDSTGIYQNYGLSHPLRSTNTLQSVAANFYLVANDTAVAPGQTVTFEIHLSDISTPIDSLYGIAFTLNLDASLVDTTQVYFDFSVSNLGTPGVNLISFEKGLYSQGAIDAAVTRTDHLNATNFYGVLGTFTITTHPTIGTLSNLVITPSQITCISTGGNPMVLNPIQESIVVDPALIGIAEMGSGSVSIFPNPANEKLNIIADGDPIQHIEINDVTGKCVYVDSPDQNDFVIDCNKFRNGIYFLKIVRRNAILHHQIMIDHD